ncbi:MAG: PDZ domain-containing protein [Actinobacteria bacterium]|nr:PDZ domain-containing protein [Actinomycetota bacterium]
MTENRPSRAPYVALGVLFLLGLATVILWNVEIPYVAFSPGPTSDAANSVTADGVETFPPNGELLMLTVVSQDVNVFEALIAGVDPNIDLVPKEAVRRPGETDEEYRNRVLQQMDDSNFRAIAVALDYLGFDLVPIEVVINEFVDGVPAASVLELGDTILEVEGTPVTMVSEIGPLLEGREVGSEVMLTVAREGEVLDLVVELAERTDEPGVAMIGVVLGELTEPPFPIGLSPGDVGGPSAGLMHTLAIIDTLTEGDLTGGQVIAGTGTIRVDGTVGPIGGIRQKVVGAEAAGALYILVPVDNYERALTAEYDTIEIVPVATLEEAVDFLDGLAAA